MRELGFEIQDSKQPHDQQMRNEMNTKRFNKAHNDILQPNKKYNQYHVEKLLKR